MSDDDRYCVDCECSCSIELGRISRLLTASENGRTAAEKEKDRLRTILRNIWLNCDSVAAMCGMSPSKVLHVKELCTTGMDKP